MEKEVYLIVGLGNPGEKYAHTRHNAGFDTLEKLAKKNGLTFRRRLLLKGETAEQTVEGGLLVYCRPLTYMNKSGECVSRLLRKYHCKPDHLMVIYDDIDLAPGRLRIRKSGGPGTHNGMRSIVSLLGTEDFPRLRVGTGDRPAGEDLAAWVLGRSDPEEARKMNSAFERAGDCVDLWIHSGIDAAMAFGNQKPKEDTP